MGATTISELEMERGIEDFEKQCWEKINITLRNNEVQEDQDDSVICDVCRSVSWQIEYLFLTPGSALVVLKLKKSKVTWMRLFGFLSKFCKKLKPEKAEFLEENKKWIIFTIFIFLTKNRTKHWKLKELSKPCLWYQKYCSCKICMFGYLIWKGSMFSYYKEFWDVYPESKMTETLIFKHLGLASLIYASSVKKFVKEL